MNGAILAAAGMAESVVSSTNVSAEFGFLEICWSQRWQRICPFAPERRFEIEDAAASLSRAVGRLDLRTVYSDGTERYLNENGAFRERAQ